MGSEDLVQCIPNLGQVELGRRLGGPHSRSGRCEEVSRSWREQDPNYSDHQPVHYIGQVTPAIQLT
jgi:hypothetical protein